MKRVYVGGVRITVAKYLFETNPRKIVRNAAIIFAVPPVPVVGTVLSPLYMIWCGFYRSYKKIAGERRIKESRLVKISEKAV
jgi:hypothetical protein